MRPLPAGISNLKLFSSDIQCNPKPFYSHVSPTVFNSTYSQERVVRIALLDHMEFFQNVHGQDKCIT